MPKRSPHFKLAKDLVAGDRAQIHEHSRSIQAVFATVLAAVPSVQVVRRSVILVTFRTEQGKEVHRTYYEGSTINLVPEGS